MVTAVIIAVGVILMIASFFVTEKLSAKDISRISELSSRELNIILEKNLEQAKTKLDAMVQTATEEAEEDIKRRLEKETNFKIQNISEYSEDVLEAIQKNHTEVMFLYSMLNEKHTELVNSAQKLENLRSNVLKLDEAMSEIKQEELETVDLEETEALIEDLEEVSEEGFEDQDRKNQRILTLYQRGMTASEIAKKLRMGIGEVRLVIGLYREEGA